MYRSNVKKTFTYIGGKYSLIPWLMPFLDVPCNHSIDVFGGSGVVLLNRDPVKIETYNDINGKVVNFFRVLRDHPDQFIAALELTPHSKQEYDEAWYDENDTPVEQARKFFVRSVQSIAAAGAQEKVKGWAAAFQQSRCNISEKTNKWINSIPGLWEVVERFRRVQIECRDFRFIFKHYDHAESLFYADSPYDWTFRSNTKYEFEFENQDFLDLHHWASRLEGKIVLSAYSTEFMMELFKDFHFHPGPKRLGNSSKEAYECVFTNF